MHGGGVWHGVNRIIFTMPVNLKISNVFSLHALHWLTCKRLLQLLVSLCTLCTF